MLDCIVVGDLLKSVVVDDPPYHEDPLGTEALNTLLGIASEVDQFLRGKEVSDRLLVDGDTPIVDVVLLVEELPHLL